MIVIDGHLDIAMNALYYNRDLKKSVAEIREEEGKLPVKAKGVACNTVAFPDLRRGGVAVSFVTVIARVKHVDRAAIDFSTHEVAYAHAQGQLAYYREMARQGVMTIISDAAGLNAHLDAWEKDPETTPLGVVLTMEGADPIVEPSQAHLWHADGLRVISLAHYGPSKYAWGTATVGPLTDDGRALLDEMAKTNYILDVTHLCDESFWEAVERFPGHMIATHSNARALTPNDRQFDDEQLKLLISRGTVIGAALDAWMIQPDWIRGVTTPENCTMEMYVDHIDHVCQLAGNADHSAIGTDLDGGYGTEQTPRDLDTIADLKTMVPELLAKRGYSDTDIEKIMWRNWVRKLNEAWA